MIDKMRNIYSPVGESRASHYTWLHRKPSDQMCSQESVGVFKLLKTWNCVRRLLIVGVTYLDGFSIMIREYIPDKFRYKIWNNFFIFLIKVKFISVYIKTHKKKPNLKHKKRTVSERTLNIFSRIPTHKKMLLI